ncbi:MAG: PKD domain-containing protein, partial [Bacteroidales bacterium]|nr:PKD domain-containing protein [Bacteroidales bacterium]
MKINTALMVLVLVLFCCGGLAQKPQKMTRNNPEAPTTFHSNFNPDILHQVKDESFHPLRRLLDDGSHKPDLTCLNNHLKSEPATSSPVEKLDSIRDYHYNPDSSKWFPEDGDYYIYDIQGRNYSIWTGWYDIQKNAIVPENKTELILTSGGMISGFIFSSWIDASQYWRPDNKYEFNFDANGNSISGSASAWNEFTKSWYYNQTDTTTYTGTGNILSRIFYQYIFDGDFWDPNNKEEYTYDGKDFLVQKNTYNWYYDAGWRWENSSETRYFNDDQGRDTSRIEYQWDILNWYESSKVSKRYDANGNKTYQEDFYWDGEVWQGSWRAIYNYDANNNLVLEESYYWNGEMREWYGSWKTVDTYNAGNRLIQSVDFQWDNIKMDWYMYVKDVNIWDASGNLIEQINSSYDTANQVFNPGQKEVYGYDMSKLMIDIAMPYYLSEESEIGESHVNKVVSKTVLSWNPQLLRYDTSYVDSLYYSGLFDAPVNDANCKADFDWRLDGNDDFLVHLTDMSDTTVVSWYWMFGDGKTSTQQNPRHLFDKPGTFRVILTTSDKSGFCNNTLVKQIKVGNPACNAAFDFTVNIENHAVTLINNSGGSNLQYYWSFG